MVTRQHLITEPPTATTCTRCRQPVLAATVGGLDRHVDPTAVTQAGELAALLASLASFEVRGNLIVHRTVWMIRADAQGPVLVEHTCRPIPDCYVDPVAMAAAVALVARLLDATPVDTGDTPPF